MTEKLRLECEKLWYGCQRCGLHNTRNHVVVGYGNTNADIMFVGEGPGDLEDRQGRPLIGPAGELFDDLIEGVGLSRDEIFVNNIVACRAFIEQDDGTKKDRPPNKPEYLACIDRVRESIYTVDPILIVAMGVTAYKVLVSDTTAIGKARGGVYEFVIPGGDTQVVYPVLATYHPSYLRRNPQEKKKPGSIWERMFDDLNMAVEMLDTARKAYLGIEPPEREQR